MSASNITDLLNNFNQYVKHNKKFWDSFSPSASELEDKAICFYLKCIVEKLLDSDVSESERELNDILKNEFTITWSFKEIENWLKKADISKENKNFITEKTEILKSRKRK